VLRYLAWRNKSNILCLDVARQSALVDAPRSQSHVPRFMFARCEPRPIEASVPPATRSVTFLRAPTTPLQHQDARGSPITARITGAHASRDTQDVAYPNVRRPCSLVTGK
jgi:hypothetical protein